MMSKIMDDNDEYDLIFKLVLIGDSGVGKTNITSCFVKNEFLLGTKATVGVEFGTKRIVLDSMNIKAQIWDTAGQERYKSITTSYYRGCNGAMIVYDITNKESFKNIEKWLSELKNLADQNVTIFLLGNKSDLIDRREVSEEEAHNKAKTNG